MEFSFSKTGTIYPYTKTEEAVSLNMEIDVLRQSIFELKTENQMLKDELCEHNHNEFSWCK